jgi:hypothetical protein
VLKGGIIKTGKHARMRREQIVLHVKVLKWHEKQITKGLSQQSLIPVIDKNVHFVPWYSLLISDKIHALADLSPGKDIRVLTK